MYGCDIYCLLFLIEWNSYAIRTFETQAKYRFICSYYSFTSFTINLENLLKV